MDILKCPVCGKPLCRENKSLFCPSRHCFDIAKSGYINLLPPNAKRKPLPGDNAEMISARASLMDSGYYAPLADAVANIIQPLSAAVVLDIGCGEGYLSRKIKERYPNIYILGIDISKFATDEAAKRCKENLYCVASSASLPVMDSSVDIAINTFAPVQISELKRVLKPNGIFIKIVPAPDHLWELKELLYETPYKNPDDAFLSEGLAPIEKKEVSYSFTACGKQIGELLQMTPYYYKTSKESIARLCAMHSVTTRLAFSVMVFGTRASIINKKGGVI